MRERRTMGIIVVVAVLIIAGVVWSSDPSHNGGLVIGTVNLDAVYTQGAAPLYEYTEQLQTEFDQQVEDLSEEEAQALFQEYQRELSQLEQQYQAAVEEALIQTAAEYELDLLVNGAVIFHGGIDVTDDVLNALS